MTKAKPKRPRRVSAYIDICHQGFVKTIDIWGYGYSDLQCACSLRFKYRIISLILYKEWEDTFFGEGFDIRVRSWDNLVVVKPYNLDLELMRMHHDEEHTQSRGITKKQERVFVCLDLARIIGAYVYLHAKKERSHESIPVSQYDPFAPIVSPN